MTFLPWPRWKSTGMSVACSLPQSKLSVGVLPGLVLLGGPIPESYRYLRGTEGYWGKRENNHTSSCFAGGSILWFSKAMFGLNMESSWFTDKETTRELGMLQPCIHKLGAGTCNVFVSLMSHHSNGSLIIPVALCVWWFVISERTRNHFKYFCYSAIQINHGGGDK